LRELLGWGTGSLQGLYLERKAQHILIQTCILALCRIVHAILDIKAPYYHYNGSAPHLKQMFSIYG